LCDNYPKGKTDNGSKHEVSRRFPWQGERSGKAPSISGREITLSSKIEYLIDELPQASRQRVEEIVTNLEGVLSKIECKFPTEDDDERAYVCLNIPKAKDIIVLIRAWNESDNALKARGGKGKNGVKAINKLLNELKIVFNQIPLVNTGLNK
jgi:hypothetical protein